MPPKKRKSKKDAAWAEAKRLCRMSVEDVRMAKELGFAPRNLIKNIPNKAQPWKLPVHLWIREMYAKKRPHQQQLPPASVQIPLPPPLPIPDDGDMPFDEALFGEPADDHFMLPETEETRHWWDEGPMTDQRIAEQNEDMLKRHREFRATAEAVSRAFAEFECVQRVVLFGSVAVPLIKEVPRFREFRRAGIAIWHECKDVDLAVWVSDLSRLRDMSKARARVCNDLATRQGFSVAHHSVDVFLMEPETNRYLGRLCVFNQCPKDNKMQCLVPGCGATLFLQQHAEFKLRPEALHPDRSVVLFERTPTP